MTTKVCRDCKVEKASSEFPKAKRNQDGLHTYCRSCNNARTVKSPSYKESVRKAHLKRKYKITPEQYTKMFEAQNGVCAICREPEKDYREYLSVDHDHATSKVRGLLCHDCNLGLGKFKDDTNKLRMAIMYLDLTKTQ
jgi:5-methylcytosine-specific restriction endonuclease McrA